MFLSDWSIKRPIETVAIFLALMCLGLLALGKLRVNQIPDVEQPVLAVTISYPGASPETVERELLKRIEKAFQNIAGVDQMYATASEGQARFVLLFAFNKNLVEAADELRNAIGSVRHKLPQEMREPVLQRIDPSAQPIMQLALSSSRQSHAELSRLAEEQLSDRFRALRGVALVQVSGALQRELSVLLRADKLREYAVTMQEVVEALQAQNATAPVGKVRGRSEDQSIRLNGRLTDPAEFEQIVVKRRGDGELVRLGQVSEVRDGFAELSSQSLRNGESNVSFAIIRTRDASTVSVAGDVRQLVTAINETLPSGTHLAITHDGGLDAQNSLNSVIHALVFGSVLTILVVYLFLNSWRSTLITAVSLPTSAIVAFIAVWLCGFTLNSMSLLGLSLAIGVLIDDAIVVRENIVRHMERGVPRQRAAHIGTAEIGFAVTATTFAIVAVFAPVTFMSGVAGEWFRPFAVTVVTSVLVSLLVSFTLDPMLSAHWGDPPNYHEAPKTGLRMTLHQFNTWFDYQAGRYGHMIAWALTRRKTIALIALSGMALALLLQGRFGGTSFLPPTDTGMIAIDMRLPFIASQEYARSKIEAAAALAQQLPETHATNSTVTSSGGRVYVDIGPSTTRSRRAAEIGRELRAQVARLVGAEYTVLDDLGLAAQKPVQIRFTGPDARQLRTVAQTFKDKLSTVAGAVDVGLSDQEPQSELQVEIHRGLANVFGVTVRDAAQALRVAFAGVEAGNWIDADGKARDVVVRLHPNDWVDAYDLDRLPIAVIGGAQVVPLEQIATVTASKGPSQIQHADGKRMITVSANVQGRSPGDVTAEALALARSMDFPPGYGMELAGASRDQQQVFREMGIALLMGIALMYFILVLQFKSFSAPVAVMVSLPLSLIGVVFALLITGSTLNLISLIGIIFLMGLVAKNAILLLDAARVRESEGQERRAALIAAGKQRLRPILMTSFALIAGMLPVAVGIGEGGEFYRPMAVAIIGGTITSTLLTLLAIPTFYDSIEIAKERVQAKFRLRTKRLPVLWALVITVLEAFAVLLCVRATWRLAMRLRKALRLRMDGPQGAWLRTIAGICRRD